MLDSVAVRDIKSGDEIFVSYKVGDHSETLEVCFRWDVMLACPAGFERGPPTPDCRRCPLASRRLLCPPRAFVPDQQHYDADCLRACVLARVDGTPAEARVPGKVVRLQVQVPALRRVPQPLQYPCLTRPRQRGAASRASKPARGRPPRQRDAAWQAADACMHARVAWGLVRSKSRTRA
jgi:hypothetical protein